MVMAVDRKYSSASSTILARTPSLLLESIWSANFSISLAWICTFAAVKAGICSPPAPGRGEGGADGTGAAGRATGMADAVVKPPATLALAGPFPPTVAAAGTPV